MLSAGCIETKSTTITKDLLESRGLDTLAKIARYSTTGTR